MLPLPPPETEPRHWVVFPNTQPLEETLLLLHQGSALCSLACYLPRLCEYLFSGNEIGFAALIGLALALDDVRERYRRVQLVFAEDAPEATFHASGVVRVHRNRRVLTVLSSAGADAVLEEARALNPASVDVHPVTLKEIFLETVAAEDANALV